MARQVPGIISFTNDPAVNRAKEKIIAIRHLSDVIIVFRPHFVQQECNRWFRDRLNHPVAEAINLPAGITIIDGRSGTGHPQQIVRLPPSFTLETDQECLVGQFHLYAEGVWRAESEIDIVPFDSGISVLFSQGSPDYRRVPVTFKNFQPGLQGSIIKCV